MKILKAQLELDEARQVSVKVLFLLGKYSLVPYLWAGFRTRTATSCPKEQAAEKSGYI